MFLTYPQHSRLPRRILGERRIFLRFISFVFVLKAKEKSHYRFAFPYDHIYIGPWRLSDLAELWFDDDGLRTSVQSYI